MIWGEQFWDACWWAGRVHCWYPPSSFATRPPGSIRNILPEGAKWEPFL